VPICCAGQYAPFILNNRDWKKATGREGKLQKHEGSAAHQSAAESYTNRMKENSSVAVHLSQAYAEQLQRNKEEKERNREVLSPIAEVVRFLARQNMSFRGHREEENGDNRGNFLELVNFLAKFNPVLKNWLVNHPSNVSWLSHDIQNEVLQLISNEVVKTIVRECNSRPYSIMCDEVSDRANKELLSLVIRYVQESGLVREAVVALIQVSNISSSALCETIIKQLNDLGLPLDYLVGQCFDGAANMSGKYNGLQARIKELSPRSPLFVHCWAHVLNLVLQDSVKCVPFCSRIFDLLQKLYVIVEGSPKRHVSYLTCLDNLNLTDGARALQSLSATRWNARCVNLRIVHRCLAASLQ
jgi:hypothetical protein